MPAIFATTRLEPLIRANSLFRTLRIYQDKRLEKNLEPGLGRLFRRYKSQALRIRGLNFDSAH
jgi:hypothetical protein